MYSIALCATVLLFYAETFPEMECSSNAIAFIKIHSKTVWISNVSHILDTMYIC